MPPEGELSDMMVKKATTRREALQMGSSVALAALLASGFGGKVLAAHKSTPEAGAGLIGNYVVVRIRKLRAGQSAEEANATIAVEFAPLMQSIPGFITYFGGGNQETGDMIYVGVFADKDAADESTRRAAEWLAETNYNFFEGDAIVVEGIINIST